MSVEKMLAACKNELELRSFAEAQGKTLIQLMKTNEKYKEEIEHLKNLISGAVPLIQSGDSPIQMGSDSEEIARIELNKLKNKAMAQEPLTLEEAKRTEIYSKILSPKLNDKDSKREREVKELDASHLLAIAESPTNG